MSMFCYQCQETVGNKGCTVKGVCGKEEPIANLQDYLIYLVKGISYWGELGREVDLEDDEIYQFIVEALFATVTNVNFDADRMMELIEKGRRYRRSLKSKVSSAFASRNKTLPQSVPEAAREDEPGDAAHYAQKGYEHGILADKNEDIRSLKWLLIYGIKGIAAYTDHAGILGKENKDIFRFLQKGLASTLGDDITVDELLSLVLEAGNISISALKLLDDANTSAYGVPRITEVFTGLKEGPAIVVSGHDLLDLEELLEQTKDKGINIYTHGEMLPAHGYPELKKYPHLTGNYGTSWYRQQDEFDKFGGAILMTTNCLQKPRESYKDRIFTTGLVGWPEVQHIADRKEGKPKDFSPVIKKALELGSVQPMEGKKIPVGFNHRTILSLADKIVEAVKSGKIKRFIVMAGCDGRFKERQYFTEVAEKLPPEAVILTAGCAKYRYNMLDLGDIGGIPRVIDAGQCNDSYSLAVVALKLAEVFQVEDVNELPISFDIAWYEQKAVCVLLALLALGVRNIRLGTTLPAFLSPNVTDVLVQKFDLKPISDPDEDVKALMTGN